MWSQFASPGGPPPPPPPGGGFAPPPPPQHAGFAPPPPPPQQQYDEYESDDSDEGGLGMTVNMVTSAASMLFSAARPLANSNSPFVAPPPPQQETSSAPPTFAPPPPAPIEQFASMLEDDDDDDDEMTEIDMNAETTTAAAPPSEAASLFDRPPTPTNPPLPPAANVTPSRRVFAPPPQPSPKPMFGRPPTPPVEAQSVFAQPPTPTRVFSQAPPTPTHSQPPTPNRPAASAIDVFAQPPTPNRSVVQNNPFSLPPPTPTTSANDVFAQPPTPTQVFSQAPPTPTNPFSQVPPMRNQPPAQNNPFAMPPPTPPQTNVFAQPPVTPNVFAQAPPTPTFAPPPPQEDVFSQPPPMPAADAVFQPPPTPNPPPQEEDVFSQPPPENSAGQATPVFAKPPPPTQEDVFSQPPPAAENIITEAPPVFEKPPPPQEDVFSQPPPTAENGAAQAPPVFEKPPPVPNPPNEDLFSQPPPTTTEDIAPPTVEQPKPSLETIDSAGDSPSKGIPPLHRVTPPVSPGGFVERKEMPPIASASSDAAMLTPLINNQSKAGQVAAAMAEAASSSSKKILLPPVADSSPPRSIARKLRGPPPRSTIPTRTPRSRFKLPTPRRARTPTRRTTPSSTTRTPGTRTPLPTPGKGRLFPSPRVTPLQSSVGSSEAIATPAKTTIEPVVEKISDETLSIPTMDHKVEQAVPPAVSTADAGVEASSTEKEVVKPVETPPATEKEVEIVSPDETISPEAASPEVDESMPEGWAEATDPSSQQIYYYNSITGETAWERPTIPKTPPAVEEQPVEEIPPTNDDSPAVEEKEAPPQVEKDSLPEGWEEATDPSTQQVYFFNSITGETAWERPTMEVAAEKEPEIAAKEIVATPPEEEPTQSATVDAAIESEALPDGWVEATDPTTQQVYYYNEASGETVWERPKASPAIEETVLPSEDEPEIAVEQTENEESSPVVEETTASKEPEAMPEGWEETIDPSTQQVYFYNALTGETAWERPTLPVSDCVPESENVMPEVAVEETLEDSPSEVQNEALTEVPFEEESETPTDPLPNDWTESVDPSSGETYYYNSETGETSWEKPTLVETSEDVNPNPNEDQATEPEPENTVQSATVDAAESPEKEIEPTEQATSIPEEEEENDDTLPDGWIDATDPVSGKPYYYHSESGTVSWDKPAPKSSEEESSDEIDLEPEVATNEDDALEDKPPLPEGWIESFDPQTQEVYYYNSVTGDVSWDRPGETQDSPEGQEETAEEEDTPAFDGEAETSNEEPEIATSSDDEKDPLPEGWIEDIDPKTEQVYYYNTFTGDVSWEKPAYASEESSEDESPETTTANAEDAAEDNGTAPETEPEISNQVADSSDALSDEWEEVDDPSTGNTYFYNRTTGETSWERPGAEKETVDRAENAEDSTPATEEEEADKIPSSGVPSIDETLDSLMADFGIEESESNQVEEEKENPVPESSLEATSDDADDLPEGWVEELDSASGQNYYYNTVTGETSWERPSSQDNPSSTEIEEEETTPEVEDVVDAVNPEYTENVETEVSSEPVQPEAQDTGEVTADEVIEESCLPEGWVEAEDPSSGQPYYYNELTGELSWDRPATTKSPEDEDLTKSESVEETNQVPDEPILEEESESINLNSNSEVENITEMDDIKEDSAGETKTELTGLPANWEQVDDPTSGTYYYNTVTGETSWDMPTDETEEGEIENSAVEDDEAEDEKAISEEQDVADIDEIDDGDDWVESTDTSTGNVYYYNSKTGETSWEKPGSTIDSEGHDDNAPEDEDGNDEDPPVEATDADIAQPAGVEESGESDSAPPSALPDGWSEVLDATTGKVAYYQNSLTNAITFTKPTVEEEATEDQATEEPTPPLADENDQQAESNDETDETDDTLPEGWAEIEDPSSGQVYYYNSSTGESSWDRPTADESQNDGVGNDSVQDADSDEAIDGDENEAAVPEDVDSPVEESTAPEEIIDDATAESTALPENWIESTDPASGQIYYYNVITEEVSWDPPQVDVDVSATPKAGEPSSVHEEEASISNEPSEEAEVSANNDILHDDADEEDELHVDSKTDDDLPVGWEEVTDPSTGQVYFYNAESGDTSWDRPTGEDAVEEETAEVAAEAEESDSLPENMDEAENSIGEDGLVNSDGDVATDLPVGWEEVEDPTTGGIYFFNADTGETSWDRPKGEDAVEEETAEDKPDILPEDIEETDGIGDSSVTNDGEVVNDLPVGWEEVEDPSSGQIYYYNAETDETSWDRPTGEAAAEETEDKPDILPENIEETENVEDNSVNVDGDVSNDLPLGWEEVEDPSSGQIYYYNSETDETSWDRPTGDNPNPIDSEDINDDIIEPKSVHEDEDETENATEDLPSGWEEVEDPTTGGVYYFHVESGETSWERPTSAETGEEDAVDGVANADVDDDDIENIEADLPDGWEEVEDPSSGEIYFYHTASGETSWERPVAGGSEGEVPPEEDEDILPDNVEEHETFDESHNEDEGGDDNVLDELPDGWKEVEDPSSGEIYFYHAESGETSWERPGLTQNQEPQIEQEQSENPAEEEDAQYNDEVAVDDSIDNDEGEADLPDGWEEVEDSSGQIYYYNAESGETSWEKPILHSPADVDDVDDTAKVQIDDDEPAGDYVDSNGEDDGDAVGALPEGWAEMEDPDSGEVYYYNAESGETSWDRPKMGESEADAPTSPSLDEFGNEAEPVAGDPQEDNEDSLREPLPEGWVESEDSSSGEIYYYHAESGEVSWERPANGLSDTIGRETSEEVTFEPKLTDDDGELPEGWVESSDPASGEVYYYHAESGDVSWEKPTDGEVAETEEIDVNNGEMSEEVDAQPIEDDSELPDGWIESNDPTSGDVYYYHAESGETSWERPTSTGAKKSVDLSIVEEEDDIYPVDASESEANEESTVPGPLPECWVESTDPSSGEIYYFNSLTQETSWERPSVDESSKISESKGDDVDDNDVSLEEDGDEPTSTQTLPLPEDWIESSDPTSGETYYYNVKTEETSWERPVDPSMDESNDVLMANDRQQMGDETNGEVDEPAADDASDLAIENVDGEPTELELLGDWVEVEDPSGGEPYYYNSKTGETRWEKPAEAEGDDAEEIDGTNQDQDTNESIDDNGLSDGWVEVVDPDSGDCYWYNNETQETTWDNPVKPADSVDEVASREETQDFAENDVHVDVNVDNNIRDDWVDVQDDMPEEETFSALPEGWVECTDPSSGDMYFYNEITNETSWDRPQQSKSSNGSSDVATAIVHETKQVSTSISNEVVSVSYIENERKKFSVSGPFTLCDDSVVTDYIMSKAQSEDILWQLIAIAVQSKGRLRSDYGVVDKSGPEAAIVKLLLSSPDYMNHTKKSKDDIVIEEKVDDEKQRQDSIVKVQDLLIRGEREHAIEEAIMIGDFATALLVASMCDPDTYKRVARKYAESKFRSDSPMYTTTMLFSGKVEAPTKRNSGNWGVAPEEIRKNWKSHLASIINNRTFGWDKIVLSLGDRLSEIGCVEEAHFCYMVCGYPITSPTDEETRAALLGCDHSKSDNRTLLTEESLIAFERTEAYEWAKRLGNQHAYFAKFQPFKLIYAILLAEGGDVTQAQKFIQSVQISPDGARAASSGIQEVSVDQMFNDDVAFELAYGEIEQQLVDGRLKSNYSESLLMGGFLEITGLKSHTVPRSSNRQQSHSFLQGRDRLQHFGTTNVEDSDPALDATFMTAKTNLMDVSGYTADDKRRTPKSSEATGKKIFGTSPPVKPEPIPAATPIGAGRMEQPQYGKKPAAINKEPKQPEQSKPASQTPKKQERPKSAPVTAPAVMTGKKEEKAKPRTPAPASSGNKPKQAPGSGAFGGMKSWIIKKLNPDAKECHLPENEEQPYYDKDLKRWIFPGDDPAEVGKPLAPPPMAMKKEEPVADTPKEDTKPKDAVSTLMAPPPSRLSSKKRIPGGMGSPMMGMMMPPGGGPPGMMTPTPLGGATTPKFATFTPKAAVFTPKPASKDGEEKSTN